MLDDNLLNNYFSKCSERGRKLYKALSEANRQWWIDSLKGNIVYHFEDPVRQTKQQSSQTNKR